MSRRQITNPKTSRKPARPLIAAILPVYNEAGRIGGVLDVLRQVGRLGHIIVVDDGSTDNSSELVRQAGQLDRRVRLIRHAHNQGKGQAVMSGRQATEAPYLLLLDTDLMGLKPQHILDLIEPAVSDETDMTLGVFRGGKWNTDFSHWLTPWLSGQRCLHVEVLDSVDKEAAQGYGLETALTIAARRHGYRVKIVKMIGVWHPPSEFHRGSWWKGVRWRLHMYEQIIHAWQVASKGESLRAKQDDSGEAAF